MHWYICTNVQSVALQPASDKWREVGLGRKEKVPTFFN